MKPSLRLFFVNLLISISTTNSLAADLTLSIQPKHVTCYGASDGAADLSVSGGTAPYSFEWNNGAIVEDVNSLQPGLYSVKVTDANGSTASACIEIMQPELLKVSVISPVSLCSGQEGEVSLSVSGGTPSYSVVWSDGVTDSLIRYFPAGNYSVDVSDGKGCSQTKNVSIGEGGGFTLTTTKTDATCYGSQDGTATVFVDGSGFYTFAWSNGSKEKTISGLAPGTYSVEVKDGAGCTETSEIAVLGSSEVAASGEVSYDPCLGAAIDLNVSGGLPPYRFFWSNGARTEDIGKLVNGTYNVSIIDFKGCLKSISFAVSGVSLMGLSAAVSDVSCNSESDGSVNLTINGGALPYTFVWSNGEATEDISDLSTGNYNVTVKDGNNCSSTLPVTVGKVVPFKYEVALQDISCHNAADGSISVVVTGGAEPITYTWSDGSSGESINNLDEGFYNLVLTDANGCTQNFDFNVVNPPELDLSASVINDECLGGAINLNVTGGSAPYTYSWAHGATSKEITSLDPGAYYAVVKDKNGCLDSVDATIVGRPVNHITVLSSDISCFGANDGNIVANVTGVNGPYRYEWSNGALTQDISGLSKGSYSLSITDNYGCLYTRTIAIKEPALLSLKLFATDVKCSGGSDGSVAAIISGGSNPYIIEWSSGATAAFVSNLSAGSYSVTITDKNGCVVSGEKTISEPFPLAINSHVSASCAGGNVSLNVEGGLQPYSFLWSNGSTNANLEGVAPGTYSVTIKDANSCSFDTSFSVPSYDPIIVSASVEGNSANATASGGNEPYSFLWSMGDTTAYVENLAAGIYTVTVTDVTGCTGISEVEVQSNSTEGPVKASIDCCSDQEICLGDEASVVVNFSGTGPYTLVFKTGSSINQITTSESVYTIKLSPSETTTIELISVANACSNGTICGAKATIAVNQCEGSCLENCFSSTVTEVIEEGNCRLIKMQISNNGYCKKGLSHLSVSIPCGEVQDISNSRNFKVETAVDPTSGISGFKIDNISNFGEAKDGNTESFTLQYRVCNNSSGCLDDFCSPLVAFKAGGCVNYQKSISVADVIASPVGQNESFRLVYPNPVESGETVTIKVNKDMLSDIKIILVDQLGKEISSLEVNKDSGSDTIEFGIPTGVRAGIYLLYIKAATGKSYRNIMIKN